MEITVEEMKQRLDSGKRVQVVDVRSPGEYASGHMPGAMNVPMEQAESRIADLHSDGSVVLVCQSGTRAEMTCDLLKSHHPGLLKLKGGTEAWINAGLPVVCSTRTRWSLERQTRLGAGLLLLTSFLLAYLISPAWLGLSLFVALGLTFAGATDICLMGIILSRMPWNRPKAGAAAPSPCG